MRFLLLSGHGAHEGAATQNISERSCNQLVTKTCKDILTGYNCEVISSGSSNYSYEKIITPGYDLVVEIHHNAGRGDGAEIWVKAGTSVTQRSNQFATILLQKYADIGQNSRGIKYRDTLGSLNVAASLNTPAVLSEFAFIDNPIDVALIDTDAELQREGQAIANSIIQFFGLKPKSTAPSAQVGFSPVIDATSIVVGNKVKVNQSAVHYATGQVIPAWVKLREYTIQQFNKAHTWILLKEITSWVLLSDVTKI